MPSKVLLIRVQTAFSQTTSDASCILRVDNINYMEVDGKTSMGMPPPVPTVDCWYVTQGVEIIWSGVLFGKKGRLVLHLA